MEILIAAIIFVGLAVFIMCFNIIFRKKPFPDSEIGHSKELRKRGIVCAKEEEMKLWGPKRGGAATLGLRPQRPGQLRPPSCRTEEIEQERV